MATNQERIGTKLDETATRDAVHIAVMPAIADDYIYPGDKVKLVYGTKDRVKPTPSGYSAIGVADPFLTEHVDPEEIFFVFLFPNTISNMRHVWTHPSIDNEQPPASDSEKWLRQFADNWNFDYEDLIGSAIKGNEYIVAMGRDLHDRSELGADYDLFWTHLENLTGKTFDVEHRESFGWSCSC